MTKAARVTPPGADPYEPGLRTPPALLDEIRGFMAEWLGHVPASTSLLIGWNTEGTRPPLFWSGQSYGKMRDFAAAIGDDQPVYGMRSLVGARTDDAESLTALTRRYAAEILDLQPDGPLLLGGHRAGAGVAFRIARALRSRGREVASLCLVEHYTPEAYDSRTAFYFSVDDAAHPFHEPETPWQALFSGPLRLHPTQSAAGGLLANADTIAAIRLELSEAAARTSARRHTSRPGPVHTRGHTPGHTPDHPPGHTPLHIPLHVKARVPRITGVHRAVMIAIDIENRGDVSLPAGTRIYDRWRRPGTRSRRFDSYATLVEELPPGGRTRVHLRVRLPLTPGLWRMDFDIASGADMHLMASPPVGTRFVLLLPGRAMVAHMKRKLRWARR